MVGAETKKKFWLIIAVVGLSLLSIAPNVPKRLQKNKMKKRFSDVAVGDFVRSESWEGYDYLVVLAGRVVLKAVEGCEVRLMLDDFSEVKGLYMQLIEVVE